MENFDYTDIQKPTDTVFLLCFWFPRPQFVDVFLGLTSCDSSWAFPAQLAARSRYIPIVSDRNHPLADRAGQRTNEPSVTIDRFYRFHPGWKYRMEFWKNLENQH